MLRIYLPADVNRTPSMTLHGIRATHPWLDNGMRVTGYRQTANDQSWRDSNMMLGDAVYEILRHFQENPRECLSLYFLDGFRLLSARYFPLLNRRLSPGPLAELLEVTDENLRRLHESFHNPNRVVPPPDTPLIDNGYSRPADVLLPNDENDIDDNDVDGLIPPIPSSFPEFDTMTLSEVKRIAENEEFLNLYVEATPEIATLRELKSSIEASNVESARANLARKNNIEALFAEIATLKQDLSDKVQQYKRLDAEQLALTQPPQVEDVIRKLHKAKKDALNESENFAKRWVKMGGDDVGDFVQKFIDVRLVYRTREAKADILECQKSKLK
jgi:hypothetical protein